MSNATPEQQLARIQAALFEGRKIEAIKLYRQATGVGLAEAKERIDAKEVQLRQSQHDGERGGLRNVGVTPRRSSSGRASTAASRHSRPSPAALRWC